MNVLLEDKTYYEFDDEINDYVVNGFSDHTLIILASQIAYDQYTYNQYKDSSLTNPIPLNNPYLNEGSYSIVGCIKDENGYDAFIVRNNQTNTDCLVNVGSEVVTDDFLLHTDWQNNFKMAQDKNNPQYESALNYFNTIKDSYNIVAVTGNSLGGGNTLYTALNVASSNENVYFYALNPAGIPNSMMHNYISTSNVRTIVNDSEILFGLQLPNAKFQTHLNYIGETIVADVGINNLNAYFVNHRGSEQWFKNQSFNEFIDHRLFPSFNELAAFDLITGQFLTDISRTNYVYICPKTIHILVNNLEIDLNNQLNLQVEQYKKIREEITTKNTPVFDLTTKINEYLNIYLNYYDKLSDFQKSLFSVYNYCTLPNLYNTPFIGIKDITSSAKDYLLVKIPHAIKKFSDDIENIVQEHLNIDIIEQTRGNLLNTTNILEEVSKSLTISHLEVVQRLRNIAYNYTTVDNLEAFELKSSQLLINKTLIDSSKFTNLETLAKKLEVSIDENIANLSKTISDFEADHKDLIIKIINLVYEDEQEITDMINKLNNLYFYDNKYFYNQFAAFNYKYLSPNFTYIVHITTGVLNGIYNEYLCFDASTVENAIKELELKKQAALNIVDICNILKEMKIGTYVREVLTYFKPTIIDTIISNELKANILSRYNVINESCETILLLINNLYGYLNTLNSTAIKDLKVSHKQIVDSYFNFIQEVNKITILDSNFSKKLLNNI